MRVLTVSLLLLANLAVASEQGAWVSKDADSDFVRARLLVVEKDSELVFNYFTEGRWRCEIPGVAKPILNSGGGKFIFKNANEYWLHNSYEGYLAQDSNDVCEVTFNFRGDTVEVKESGNCRSFCGAGGGLDAVLKRISN